MKMTRKRAAEILDCAIDMAKQDTREHRSTIESNVRELIAAEEHLLSLIKKGETDENER